MKTVPTLLLLLIGASIGISVGASLTMLQEYGKTIHPGAVLIRELRATQEDGRGATM